jgi:hypothetical protein
MSRTGRSRGEAHQARPTLFRQVRSSSRSRCNGPILMVLACLASEDAAPNVWLCFAGKPAYSLLMSTDDAKTKESQRKEVRYAVSEDCRLRASILLQGADDDSTKKDWPGTLVDMSATGAHIQISLGAVAYIGNSCVVTLAHNGMKTEVRGTLAHYVCSARYSVCGVRFNFSFSGADKAYQPFFKAIVASAALTAGPAGAESAGRYREEFRGPDHAKLEVWRTEAGGTLTDFDYTMARYRASLTAAGPEMPKNKEQVRFKLAGSGDTGAPLSRSQEAEARWEFSLAASNLPKGMAPDIRRLLRLVS